MTSPDAIRRILEKHLSPDELELFDESHLKLMEEKAFRSEKALRRVSKAALQAPPGEALPLILIQILLDRFGTFARYQDTSHDHSSVQDILKRLILASPMHYCKEVVMLSPDTCSFKLLV